MAPLCLSAGSRPVFTFHVLFIVALLLCLFAQGITSLLVYDREFLLNIHHSTTDLCSWNSGGQNAPVLTLLPADICCIPDCSLHKRKRKRRRGKRGGVLVRLRRLHRAFAVRNVCLVPVFPELSEQTLKSKSERFYSRSRRGVSFVNHRSLGYVVCKYCCHLKLAVFLQTILPL